MRTSDLYVNLWTSQRTIIIDKLKVSSSKQSVILNPADFSKVGNRGIYSFNLEFKNGIVCNNIGGSAVARDLAKVLNNSIEAKKILNSGHFKIRMDKGFTLWLEKL